MTFEVKNGGFRYHGEREILRDVSFQVKDAEILSVLGANGAGKTTLMKCMLGLLRWTSGASFLNGKDVRTLKSKAFWREVGYVPQAKLPSFVYTVGEMVVMGRSSHLGELSQPGEKDWQKVDECLKTVGIFHLKDKLCSRISGGEYQMALIARALVSDPSLLVLDEPESNLDFKNQRIVLDTISWLCKEKGLAAILNTHYPEHAVEISHKALLLFPDGTSLAGDAKDVIGEKNLEKAFDVPVRICTIDLPEKKYTCVLTLPSSVQHKKTEELYEQHE